MRIYVYTYTNIWDVFWVYNYDDQFLDVSREGVFFAYKYIYIYRPEIPTTTQRRSPQVVFESTWLSF